MTHLFVDPADMTGDTLIITGADYNHIKNVLRMRPGDELSVSNGTDSREYRYGIEEIREDGIVCRLRFIKEADVELPVRRGRRWSGLCRNARSSASSPLFLWK